MDNLNSHKVAGVRQAIEAAGAETRFLPPYSPDMDPIEQVFAKVKHTLRKMARRNVDALWNAVGVAIDEFSPTDDTTGRIRAPGAAGLSGGSPPPELATGGADPCA